MEARTAYYIMIIAVDFDGTVCEDKYPEVGIFLPGAVETLKALYTAGHDIVLWTCRRGKEAEAAWKACMDAGIPFSGINEGDYCREKHTYKKLFADLYIDDKSLEHYGRKVIWDAVANKLLHNQTEELLYQGDWIRLVSPVVAPYEAVQAGDGVQCLLVDTERRVAFVRREHCPPYEYGTGVKYWYTPIGGGIADGETPLQALIREVKEEAGIDLNQETVEIKKLFSGKFVKYSVDNTHVFLVLGNGYNILKPKGDGTVYEKESMTFQVPLEEVLDLHPHDFLLEALWSMAAPYLKR
jgi:8-oxo-dGTP pyrophosphatase MutT (NUDIX family)